MGLNGRAERGWIGSGNDNGRLKEGRGIRICDVMKVDSGTCGGLYLQTDTALTGTLTTLVTGVI